MNCANHVDVPAVAYCRTCGKPLCSSCTRDVRGVIYCEECLASHVSGTMPPPGTTAVPPGVQPPTHSSPNLAALLGLIPGVGAFYNGEYAKGFVHVIIFATLIWMSDHVSGLFGIAIAAFYLYMPIEAYKTAKARELGLPAPDPFGFNNLFGTAPTPPQYHSTATENPSPGFVPNPAPPAAGAVDYSQPPPGFVPVQPLEEVEPQKRVPTGAFILIGLGVLLLLNQLDIFHFDWGKFWPVILIFFGVVALLKRQRPRY